MSEQHIVHPRYGQGLITASRHQGFEFRVTFGDGSTRWVRSDEIKSRPMAQPVAAPQAVSLDLRGQLKERRMIEAFRLGIVPSDCVRDFTFGRDEETAQLQTWLDATDQSTLLLVGDYGSGKTHFLQHACGRALQEGFAVALVEMHPRETPFHKPKRVYGGVVRSLRYPWGGRLGRFRDLVGEVLAQGAWEDHAYLRHLRDSPDEYVWDWIEARESIVRPWHYGSWYHPFLPSLYDYSTAANIYCYLLSALGWAARKVLGLRGLLLLFDEAESVDDYLYPYQHGRGCNFLRALVYSASDDKLLTRAPFGTGLNYCGVGIGPNIPFLYRPESGMKLLLAFTSTIPLNDVRELREVPRIALEPLSDEALKEVIEQICLLYAEAYGFLQDDPRIEAVFRRVSAQGGRTRLFVKGAVESLDIARLVSERRL